MPKIMSRPTMAVAEARSGRRVRRLLCLSSLGFSSLFVFRPVHQNKFAQAVHEDGWSSDQIAFNNWLPTIALREHEQQSLPQSWVSTFLLLFNSRTPSNCLRSQ